MKKLFLFTFLSISVMALHAQIQWGIKAGYNLSNLNISGANGISNQKSKSGFNAGIFSTIHLFNSCLLQPEISYSEQGTHSKDSSAKSNYNFLNIPVLFKYQHSSGLFIETGPQIGFLLKSEYVSQTYSEDLKSTSKSTDFSWVFGAGYKISRINVGLDVRYNYGLTNVRTYTIFTTQNRVLQIDLFYLFK